TALRIKARPSSRIDDRTSRRKRPVLSVHGSDVHAPAAAVGAPVPGDRRHAVACLGNCGAVAASVTGHWLVGYFAHNRGPRSWHIEGAGVQGYNVPWCGLITMGEAWHNNHHAFPGSARLGLGAGEADPGWWVLLVLARLGLV